MPTASGQRAYLLGFLAAVRAVGLVAFSAAGVLDRAARILSTMVLPASVNKGSSGLAFSANLGAGALGVALTGVDGMGNGGADADADADADEDTGAGADTRATGAGADTARAAGLSMPAMGFMPVIASAAHVAGATASPKTRQANPKAGGGSNLVVGAGLWVMCSFKRWGRRVMKRPSELELSLSYRLNAVAT